MSETRKLAAILVADVVGYSRLAGAEEDRILARLRTLRSDLIDPTIAVHHGHIVKRTGDGSIIEFRSVVDAVRCAIEVQGGLAERNAGLPPEKRIEYRVGIHLGDVVEEEDGDLMGQTTQPGRAKVFYGEVLGLKLEDDNPFVIVFSAGRDPDWSVNHSLKGSILRFQARYPEAVAEHERALALDPS